MDHPVSVVGTRAHAASAPDWYHPVCPASPDARPVRAVLRHDSPAGLDELSACFRWQAIGEELIERPYITVGFVAYMILLALGVTSPKAMVRRLGKNWKKLHRLVYVAGILAVVHLLWILRTDVWEAVVYGAVLAVLLGFRLFRSYYLRRS